MLPGVPVHQAFKFLVIEQAVAIAVGTLEEHFSRGHTFRPVNFRGPASPCVLHFMSAQDFREVGHYDHASTVLKFLEQLRYARLNIFEAGGQRWQRPRLHVRSMAGAAAQRQER